MIHRLVKLPNQQATKELKLSTRDVLQMGIVKTQCGLIRLKEKKLILIQDKCSHWYIELFFHSIRVRKQLE